MKNESSPGIRVITKCDAALPEKLEMAFPYIPMATSYFASLLLEYVVLRYTTLI
jgi:hypothetical protein